METNTSRLILEAESLRAQAKAIMAEALAMEQELKESRARVRKSKVRDTDDLLDQWFRVDTVPIIIAASEATISRNSNDTKIQDDEVDKNSDDFPSAVANVTTVALRLEEQKVTPEQVLMVVDRIFERQMEVSGQTAFLQNGHGSNPNLLLESSSDDRQRAIHNETEYDRLNTLLDVLVKAAALVDERYNTASTGDMSHNLRWSGRVEPSIRARLNELRRTQKVNLDRKLMAEISKAAKSATGSVEEYVRRTLVGQVLEDTNVTVVQEGGTAVVPLWVPSTFIPFLITSASSPFGSEQVTQLKDQVLMGSRFYVTSYHSISGAAIFRGNIRGATANKAKQSSLSVPYDEMYTAQVFQDIQQRLSKVPALKDSVQLFFLPDPEWKPNKDDRAAAAAEPKPVILALPKDLSPDESKLETSNLVEIVKKFMYPLTVLTTMRYAIEGFALNKTFFNAVVKQRDLKLLLTMCMPVVGGIFAMHVLQEVVHYWVAKSRRIRIGPPVPIPSIALGAYGCITPLKSFPSTRAALLDFSLSGPFAMTLASVGCIVASVLVTVRASPAALATFPVVPAILFKSSLVAGTLTSWIASKLLMLPLAQPISIHPLFLVGYSGLVASGLNLLPIFRLDGGRACTAAMGPRQSAVISVSMLLFLFSLGMSGGTGLGFSWAVLATLFQRKQEIPAQDEVTEVDNLRLGAWMFSFLLSIGILTPFPGAPGML